MKKRKCACCGDEMVNQGKLEVKEKNGKLYAISHKTGLVYEIVNPNSNYSELKLTNLALKDL
jgi:hypothetical protein